jgi:hypothetical protein
MNLTGATAYQTNLANMMARVRPDLRMNPSAPIRLVQESLTSLIALMHQSGTCSLCDTYAAGDALVRAADTQVAATLPAIYVIDSSPQPRTGLGIHVANVGELSLGAQLAPITDTHFVQ